MGFFRKKDKKREKKIPIRSKRIYIPKERKKLVLTTREYRLFRGSGKGGLNWYEKLARGSEKLIKMSPDKKSREALESAIGFTGLQITPESVMSLFLVTIIMFIAVSIPLIITGFVPIIGGIMLMALGLLVAYYFLKYPISILKEMRMKASSQVVLAVLYMVVSMRISPNLERAFRFAAANVSGPLALDMRRLIWDMEMRKYYSADDAMSSYIEKWKPENEEFSEAMRLIRNSEKHIPERAKVVLDQALEVILDGTKTRMKHYAQDLKLPVMVIHMMGIVLPILGTIMAPLAAVFMADMVQPIHFILGYNIILPIVIIWFINNTLKKRPVTFSQVDISKHPDIPRKGCFRLKGRSIPALPFALMVMLAIVIPISLFFFQNSHTIIPINETVTEIGPGMGKGECILFSNVVDNCSIISLSLSILMIMGIGFGLGIYFILSNMQKNRVQGDVQKTEGEFELALFQLGNEIKGGTPIEVAIERSIQNVKDLKIAGLFRLTLRNMRSLGMTFENALFDRKWGSLKYYPSRLIKNVMYTVVDTSKRGVTYAAESMLRIARYLKSVRETQEYIRDMLSDTVSSMKFQAYFLTPLITGLIVSMAHVIVSVLTKLGEYLDGLGLSQSAGLPDMSMAFGNMQSSTSPEVFQLIVGVYLIEVIIILGMFLSRISKGEDKVSQWYSVGKLLILGIVIYFIVALASISMFAELIEGALAGLGIV